MSVRFKSLDRDQQFLLPPSLLEWLPPGDLAYFVIDVVDQLDLSGIYSYYQVREDGTAKASSGQPPFHPKMMTALLLYAYALGTPSSRRIARLCERDAGYRIVAANQQPDFRTISEFRRIHLKALGALFVQVLQLAREAGLVKLGHVALDGTKIKANASKHKAMSYARMLEREAEYAQQVEDLLSRAEHTDAAEDERYGSDRRGDELPKELAFRKKRLERLGEAKRALEEAAREKARAEGKLDENDEPKPPARGRPPKVPPGTPKPKDQYNFTDPESRIMKMGNGSFDQAYNCQAAVDGHAQIIVARRATDAPNDKRQLEPMVEQIEANLGEGPRRLSADSGYYSEENVTCLRERGIDDYVCPDRLKHGEEPPRVRGRPPKNLSFTDRVRRKLWTQKGRATYALRKQIVEPVFGQTKMGRGLRQFLLRGLEKVDGEWSLWCTGHNVLKLWAAATG
ncbi:IS1182 family transposase [Planctomycetota bacterium]